VQVDENGYIIDSKFKTFGCGSAIASSSVATEWVKGKSLEEVTKIRNSDIAKHLSLPPVKLHCSMLAEDAIKVPMRVCACMRAGKGVAGMFTRYAGLLARVDGPLIVAGGGHSHFVTTVGVTWW
jgi:hypothetical protein